MYSLDNRHKFARPAWARPGFSTFAKKDDTEGDDKDDDLNDDGDDDDSEDEDDDDEGDDDPDADKSEEELRAELKATRESLDKASGSGKSKRDKIKALERELDEARKGKPAAKKHDDDKADKVDADAIRAEARREAEVSAKKVRIADKAELALARADVDPGKLSKGVRLLDLEELDLDDDGTLDGIDDQLDKLKRDWPELFTVNKRRKRKSVAGKNDRDGKGGGSTKSTDQLQADQLLGRTRRR